jgi:hypothetical protein
MERLLRPSRLWTRSEVLARPSPVPRAAGFYGWYFRTIPPGVPVERCIHCEDLTLLYAGIAPKPPPAAGGPASAQTLWHRIRYHYRGNAAGSTLRLTLGCLLADELGLELRRVGSGRRMTFRAGEATLSNWMAANALVAWVTHPMPWQVERDLIASTSLPLNLDQNRDHDHHRQLSEVRRLAKVYARRLPICS